VILIATSDIQSEMQMLHQRKQVVMKEDNKAQNAQYDMNCNEELICKINTF